MNEFCREEWRPVRGWEGFYEVSNIGRVRSVGRYVKAGPKGVGLAYRESRILKQGKNPKDGRPMVSLWRDNKYKRFSTHVLVLEAFVGPRPEGMWGLHGKGGCLDNRVENLYWGTPSRNNFADKLRDGTYSPPPGWGRGNKNKNAKATPEIVRAIRESDEILKVLASRYGLNISTVSEIRRRRTWAHLP